MAELVFRCPACDFAHKVDGARVGPAGIRGTCRGCSAPLAVYPDGRVEGAPPAPPVPPPPTPASERTVLAGPRTKLPPLPPQAAPESPAPPRRPAQEPLSSVVEPPPAAPEAGLVPFRCPYCGASAERPQRELDPAGTRSVCGTCVQFFVLFPDGRTVEADEEEGGTSAPTPAAPVPAVPAETPPGRLVLFACPFCGAPLEREVDRIAAGGMEVACAVCVQLFRIFPDGRAEEPPAPASGGWSAPDPTPPSAPAPVPAPPPVDPAVLLFHCPTCGKEIRLPREKIPAAGVRGKCAGCQTRLILNPDGSASEVSKTAPAGDMTKWYYRLGADELGPFSLAEVGELVRSKAVQAQTPLKPAGGEWASAATFAPLAPFLAAAVPRAPQAPPPEEGPVPDGPLGDEDRCYAHPGAPPVRCCSECLRYLCQSCVVEKQVPGVLRPLKVCAACGGSTATLARRVGWTPFFHDIPAVLLAPVKGHAIFYLGILALLEVFQVLVAMAPFVGFFGMLIVNAVQWSYLLHVTREVAGGSYEMPTWPDMGHFSEVFFRFIKVLFVTVVALLPVIIVFCFVGAAAASTALAGTSAGAGALLTGTGFLLLVGAAVAAFFYLFYLPMSIGIVAVFDTVLPALNPVIIFRIMSRIGPPWVLAALFWFSLAVFDVGCAVFLKVIPFAGVLLTAAVSSYCMLLFSYTLGRVFAENDHKIGWK